MNNDYECDGYWDTYQFKAYILTKKEYEKLTCEKEKEKEMEPKVGINFNQSDMEIIKELITELKLHNEKSGITNNFHIECGAFMGNEDDARKFALMISDYLNEETNKESQ
jgi:hypothetical protein